MTQTQRRSVAQSRLLALLRFMSDGRFHKKLFLAETLGVSPRTILRDIEALESAGFNVEVEFREETGVQSGRYRLHSFLVDSRAKAGGE